jgi:hypothetical protein
LENLVESATILVNTSFQKVVQRLAHLNGDVEQQNVPACPDAHKSRTPFPVDEIWSQFPTFPNPGFLPDSFPSMKFGLNLVSISQLP